VNLLLGKIYLNEGLKSKAEEAYTMALRQNPYALEAAQALAELAGSKETTTLLTNTNNESSNSTSSTCRPREIEKFYTKLASMRASTKFISRPDAHWMQTFVNAHLNIKRSKPKGNNNTVIAEC
jgi:tetratricopeptide (TPR) repeat protein